MKLRLVHYDNGKVLGCSQDDVWFIIFTPERCSIKNPARFVNWDSQRKMPAEYTAVASPAAYTSVFDADNDFHKLENYYRNNGGFRTIKEIEI